MDAGWRTRPMSESGAQPTLEEITSFIERRLFVARLPAQIDEAEIREVFSQYGEVTELKVVPDRRVCFVGYNTWAEVHRALIETDDRVALTGNVKGSCLSCCFSERTHAKGRSGEMSKGMDNARVFVGNLPQDVTEGELHELFAPYGNIQSVQLIAKGRRDGKVAGFVQFSIWGEALDAMKGLDGVIYPEGERGAQELSVVLAEPKREGRGGGGAPASESSRWGSGGPPAKRPRIDMVARDGRVGGGGLSATQSAMMQDYEQLKEDYIIALDDGLSPVECTRLHWAILDMRAALNGGDSGSRTFQPLPPVPFSRSNPVTPRASLGGKWVDGGSWTGRGGGNVGDASGASRTGEGESRWRGKADLRGADESRGDPMKDPNAARLYIGCLPKTCVDSELAALVDQVVNKFRTKDRDVLECRVVPGRGFGYLQFSSWEAAEEALDALDDRQVTGWPQALQAKWSRPKNSRDDDGGDMKQEPREDVDGGGVWRSRSRNSRPRSLSREHASDAYEKSARSYDDDDRYRDDERRLFVGQIRKGASHDQVMKSFRGYGTIDDVRYLAEKGIAYITFASAAEASKALKALNGKDVQGVSCKEGLNVQMAKPRH